ncbi:hypothetical protein IAT38_007207 [Cryptococcus sp. DSM 104549]
MTCEASLCSRSEGWWSMMRILLDNKGEGWSDSKIAEEIENIGFEATVVEKSEVDEVELRVYGLKNADVVPLLISTTTEAIAGVHMVTYPPPYTHLALTHSPLLVSLRSILASLQKHRETALWRRTFILSLSATFAVPVFVVGMLSMYLPRWLIGWTMWRSVRGVYLGGVVCLALTLPVQVWLARRFYTNAWKSVKHGSATM